MDLLFALNGVVRSVRIECFGELVSKQFARPPRTDGHEVSPIIMTAIPSKARQEMIAVGGRFCQQLGLPRTTGQIYGLLYLSLRPLSLDDIVALLGISKASASTGTRQLLAWGAIRQTWMPGERRDHFEAVEDLRQWIRAVYRDFVKPRLTSSKQRLDSMRTYLEEEHQMAVISAEEYKLCCDRLRNLQRVQHKLQSLSPLAERLL